MDTTAKRDEIRRQQNKPWYVKSPWFERELAKALEEIDESHGLEKLFEMQHRRSQEADKRWQEATGKHDTIPDLGDLLQWLMNEIDRLQEELVIAEREANLNWRGVRDGAILRTKEVCKQAGWDWVVQKVEGSYLEGYFSKADFKQAIDSVGKK